MSLESVKRPCYVDGLQSRCFLELQLMLGCHLTTMILAPTDNQSLRQVHAALSYTQQRRACWVQPCTKSCCCAGGWSCWPKEKPTGCQKGTDKLTNNHHDKTQAKLFILTGWITCGQPQGNLLNSSAGQLTAATDSLFTSPWQGIDTILLKAILLLKSAMEAGITGHIRTRPPTACT